MNHSGIKKIFALFFFIMSLCASFAQEGEEERAQEAGRIDAFELEDIDDEKKIEAKTEPNDTSLKATDAKEDAPVKYRTLPYGFYIGAKFATNRIDHEEKDMPFAVNATVGFEYEYKIKHFALQPSFDLTFMHYLWTGSIAAHAENENRTAFTIALVAELPFMLHFDIQRWNISFGLSLAFLLRGSLLDLGVKANEIVSEGGITAKEEVASINKYHWKSGRFFYPALRLKTEYILENGWKAGVLFSTYLPIFNLWSAKIANTKTGKVPFIHDGIFTLAIVIHPGRKL